MITTGACEAFVSTPIKLAAKISERGRRAVAAAMSAANETASSPRQSCLQLGACPPLTSTTPTRPSPSRLTRPPGRRCASQLLLVQCVRLVAAAALLIACLATASGALNSQLISRADGSAADSESSLLRHQAHYLHFVPSAHFSYHEGRQANGRSLELPEPAPSSEPSSGEAAGAAPSSHIYKRSSAVLMPPSSSSSSGQPLVGGRSAPPPSQLSARALLNPLSRRMMANGGAPATQAPAPSQQPDSKQHPTNNNNNWLGVGTPAASTADQELEAASMMARQMGPAAADNAPAELTGPAGKRRQAEHEAELLRQKQHIQYHDQWPSMAGKCHKRTLNFCASVLPFNTTTFPNIIGDTNRFEVKRSLPFFGFLAKSSCNKRLDELLCLLLEPPCSAHSGAAIPPCKKFCRLALEGCNEYIPATLALSSVFDCRQYPDSNDPGVCVNLAQGSKCAPDEFKCPDKTCIPRE
jgi:hypothetical protein